MATLTEAQVIRLMRDEYRRRLVETIEESDVFDDRGNNLLSPGLKVRHKDSNYEYTVDSVSGEEGNTQITLKLPDEPRFEPPGTHAQTVIADELEPNVLGELDDDDLGIVDPTGGHADELEAPLANPDVKEPSAPDDTVFVIDQEEFEKEYEVT
jgi:hypothetical protein